MLIQGIVGMRKSHLIDFLKDIFVFESLLNSSPLLLLAPTGVAMFNIKVLTIHYALRIPLVLINPLEGKALMHIQEKLHLVKYILIVK